MRICLAGGLINASDQLEASSSIRSAGAPSRITPSQARSINAAAAVVKGASLVAGWALAGGSKERYWGLYKATHAGGRGEDCTVTYPVPGHSCDTFPWQTADMMNTQYDHIEL